MAMTPLVIAALVVVGVIVSFFAFCFFLVFKELSKPKPTHGKAWDIQIRNELSFIPFSNLNS